MTKMTMVDFGRLGMTTNDRDAKGWVLIIRMAENDWG